MRDGFEKGELSQGFRAPHGCRRLGGDAAYSRCVLSVAAINLPYAPPPPPRADAAVQEPRPDPAPPPRQSLAFAPHGREAEADTSFSRIVAPATPRTADAVHRRTGYDVTRSPMPPPTRNDGLYPIDDTAQV